MYDYSQNGNSDYRSWMQIPSGLVITEEMNEAMPLQDRKYAKLVYNINPNVINISGDINTTFNDTMTISGHVYVLNSLITVSGDVGITTGKNATTNVLDVGTFPLASKIHTIGTDIYVAEALPGTALSASTWRCKKISEAGSLMTISWADGDALFNNIASDLSALIYI